MRMLQDDRKQQRRRAVFVTDRFSINGAMNQMVGEERMRQSYRFQSVLD